MEAAQACQRWVHDGKKAACLALGGELPRLKDSDHQKCTAGQRGKCDREARLRLPGGLAALIG